MNYYFILFFLISGLTFSQDCINTFTEHYDEFDKELKSERDFYVGFEDEINFFNASWNATLITKNGDKVWTQFGGTNNAYKNGNNIIVLELSARLRIKDCNNPSCWIIDSTTAKDVTSKNWIDYLNNNIGDLRGFGYVQFLSKSGDVLKIHTELGSITTRITLNDVIHQRTVDNYKWLQEHDIDKIRFYSPKNSQTLDIDLPNDYESYFKYMIDCIEKYKKSKFK